MFLHWTYIGYGIWSLLFKGSFTRLLAYGPLHVPQSAAIWCVFLCIAGPFKKVCLFSTHRIRNSSSVSDWQSPQDRCHRDYIEYLMLNFPLINHLRVALCQPPCETNKSIQSVLWPTNMLNMYQCCICVIC